MLVLRIADAIAAIDTYFAGSTGTFVLERLIQDAVVPFAHRRQHSSIQRGQGRFDRTLPPWKPSLPVVGLARGRRPPPNPSTVKGTAIRYSPEREEVRMDTTVDVTIPVEARAASELRDARTREAIGRLVSRLLDRQRQGNIEQLFAAMERLGADAEANGLTDEILEEELAAYNAERRR
jgi:hypothetical protein